MRIGGMLNKPVERMAAGEALFRFARLAVGAIAHFFRWAADPRV